MNLSRNRRGCTMASSRRIDYGLCSRSSYLSISLFPPTLYLLLFSARVSCYMIHLFPSFCTPGDVHLFILA